MFTPIHTSLGALLLFEGSSGLLFHNGAVFGISSLISGSVFNPSRDNVPIVAGLVSSVLPVYLLVPSLLPSYPAPPNSLLSAVMTMGVGFLLGWGTKVRASKVGYQRIQAYHYIQRVEWPRLYLRTHALRFVSPLTTLIDRNGHLLHLCPDHRQLRQRRIQYPFLWISPMLHTNLPINSRVGLHGWCSAAF